MNTHIRCILIQQSWSLQENEALWSTFRFMFLKWQLVCKFGTVIGNFLSISCPCSCFCTLSKLGMSYVLSHFTLKYIFHIKYFALLYSIDVVSILSYYVNLQILIGWKSKVNHISLTIRTLIKTPLLLLEWSIDYTLIKLVHSESICFTQVKFDYEYKLHMLVASIIVGDQQATLALWYNWPKSKDMNLLETSDAFQCNSVQIWYYQAQIKYE